jgi:sulfite exporter TauE/SafE
MCGGLVSFVAGGGKGKVFAQINYHGGRLLSYATLGVIAGGLGAQLDLAGALGGFERSAALVAGVLLIFWGLKGLFSSKVSYSSASKAGTLPYRIIGKLFSFCFGEKKENWPLRALLLGILSGVFPCGWLYAFVAMAAATASLSTGLMVMVAFWAGTIPILVMIGGLSRVLAQRCGRYAPQTMSAILVLAGLFSVATHLGIIGMDHSHHTMQKGSHHSSHGHHLGSEVEKHSHSSHMVHHSE